MAFFPDAITLVTASPFIRCASGTPRLDGATRPAPKTPAQSPYRADTIRPGHDEPGRGLVRDTFFSTWKETHLLSRMRSGQWPSRPTGQNPSPPMPKAGITVWPLEGTPESSRGSDHECIRPLVKEMRTLVFSAGPANLWLRRETRFRNRGVFPCSASGMPVGNEVGTMPDAPGTHRTLRSHFVHGFHPMDHTLRDRKRGLLHSIVGLRHASTPRHTPGDLSEVSE